MSDKNNDNFYDIRSLDDPLTAYLTQQNPNVFTNVNNPAISFLDTAFLGDPNDIRMPPSVLMEFKDLYTPTELTSILNDYETQTGDKEGAALLKTLFGTDTTLADTAIKEAAKMPVGEGDTFSAGNENILSKLLSNKNLLQAGLGGLGALASYKSAKDAQKQAAGVSLKKNAPVTATRTAGKGTRYAADGGLMGLARGRYLDGHSDGMADRVPAQIDNRRPAALSDGEFVIPADVVSHLGNGNSNAGAKRLYKMMDDIRAARTGNPKQGKQINPDKFMPR